MDLTASSHSANPPVPRLGLLGGSFDPVHLAHVELARRAIADLDLEKLILLPAAQPWQRESLGATAQQRLEMLEIAVSDEPAMEVSDIEIRRGGPTYTLDTLRELPPGPQYFWILGADQLQNFCTWHGWREILSLVTLAVAARPGAQLQAPHEMQAHLAKLNRGLHVLSMPPTDVSATAIRNGIAQGEARETMLHPGVAQYIQQHGLYRLSAE